MNALEKLKAAVNWDLVVVAGTGVSRAAAGSQPVDGHEVVTWHGLVKHGANYCLERGFVNDEQAASWLHQVGIADTANLILVAEAVQRTRQQRSQGVFSEWLAETVGKLKVHDGGTPGRTGSPSRSPNDAQLRQSPG